MRSTNQAAYVTLTIVGLLFFWSLALINIVILIIGVSTVPDDAPETTANLVRLLLMIAGWDWRVLLGLAALALLGHYYAVLQIYRFVNQARSRLVRLQPFEERLEALQDVSADSIANAVSRLEAALADLKFHKKQMAEFQIFGVHRAEALRLESLLDAPLMWHDPTTWRKHLSAWESTFNIAMGAASHFKAEHNPHPGMSGKTEFKVRLPNLVELGLNPEIADEYHRYIQMRDQFRFAGESYADALSRTYESRT